MRHDDPFHSVVSKAPVSVKIVAVRAKQVGVKVRGPWEFELIQ